MDKITIIVPAYNAENTIERCLASFISNREWIQEVILVNDRTTDNTFSKIDQFRQFFDIRVINNEGNKGPGPGRKTGLLAANSEWITFVDADDCLTPSSLRYVSRYLAETTELVLLNTQTIYYESGNFVKEHVEHSDYSCGGNFYRLRYLKEHKLFPHDSLFMAEDECFNHIIDKYIQRYGDPDTMRNRYDYPVYEVHHDFDIELSFSFHHWNDYLCKYHLQKTVYAVDFFKNDLNLIEDLKHDLFEGLIFGFYVFQGIMQNTEFEPNEHDMFLSFHEFIVYCRDIFNISAKEIVEYYKHDPEWTRLLYNSACDATGVDIKKEYSFSKFIQILYKYQG